MGLGLQAVRHCQPLDDPFVERFKHSGVSQISEKPVEADPDPVGPRPPEVGNVAETGHRDSGPCSREQ